MRTDGSAEGKHGAWLKGSESCDGKPQNASQCAAVVQRCWGKEAFKQTDNPFLFILRI